MVWCGLKNEGKIPRESEGSHPRQSHIYRTLIAARVHCNARVCASVRMSVQTLFSVLRFSNCWLSSGTPV